VCVSHPWAGKGWDTVAIPRIGQEVIVDFLEGDPDQPIITGWGYNGANQSFYQLPSDTVISGLRSNSTKSGGGYNEYVMDDTKGKELIREHGQFDKDSTIEHDLREHVLNDRSRDVTNNETIQIGKDRAKTVSSNETTTIGANRTENVGANEMINIAQTRTRTVGANETVNVGGQQAVTIGRNRSVAIGAGLSERIGNGRDVTIGTILSEKVGTDWSETVGKKSLVERTARRGYRAGVA